MMKIIVHWHWLEYWVGVIVGFLGGVVGSALAIRSALKDFHPFK